MKKLLKSLLTTLLVSMVFIGVLSVNVSADTNWGSDTTATLTITNAKPGDEFIAWLVVTIDHDAEGNDLTYAYTGAAKKYFEVEKGITIDQFMQNYNEDKTAFNELLAGLPEKIYKDYKPNEIPVDPVPGEWRKPLGGNVTANEYGVVTIENCKAGGYFIMPVNTTDVYQPIFAALIPEPNSAGTAYVFPNKTHSLEAKRKAISSDAKIKKNSDSAVFSEAIYATKSNLDNDQVHNGAKVQVVIDVPKYVSPVRQTLNLAETLPTGVTYVANSLKVLHGSNPVENYGTFTAQDNIVNVVFDYDNIKSYNQLIIEYEVTLNENAVFAATKLDNNPVANTIKSEYTYSTYPYSTSQVNRIDKTITNTLSIYTLGIEVYKHGDAYETELKDAEFSLYRLDENGGSAIRLEANGTDHPAKLIKSGLKTDDNGIFKLEGLEEGIFYLVETKAPTGYKLDKIAKTIEVKHASVNENGYIHKDVQNTKAVLTLPTTGATGMIAFTVVGLSVMTVAIIILASTKHNNVQR